MSEKTTAFQNLRTEEQILKFCGITMDSSAIVYVSVKKSPLFRIILNQLLSLLEHAQSLALVPPALPLLISTIFNMVFIHFYNEMLVGFKECLFKFKFNSFDNYFVMNHCAFIHN